MKDDWCFAGEWQGRAIRVLTSPLLQCGRNGFDGGCPVYKMPICQETLGAWTVCVLYAGTTTPQP